MPTSWNILLGFGRQPLSLSIADTLGANDQANPATTSLRSVSGDSFGATDSWSRSAANFQRAISEGLGANDYNIIPIFVPRIGFTLEFINGIYIQTNSFRKFTDNLALSDQLATIQQKPSVTTWQIRVAENLGNTDQTNSPIVTWRRGPQDNLGVSGNPAASWRKLATQRKVIENIGTSDQTTAVNTSPGTGAPSLAQISVTTNPANEVIQTGQTLGVTYTISQAVAAWLMTPDGQISLIADGQPHTIQYDSFQSGIGQQVSSVVFIQAQDQFGNIAAYRFNAIVQDSPALPALDPTITPTVTNVSSNQFVSVKSGNWTDPTVWGNPIGGAVPGRDSISVVSLGTSVSASGRTCQTGRLIILGTFSFANGGFYVTDIDGRAKSTFNLGDGQSVSLILLRNRTQHANDTSLFWPAVNIQGAINIDGAPVTPYGRLVGDARAGDKTLTLTTAPSGWKASNKLFIPDTRQTYDPGLGGNLPNNFEIAQVRAVVGNVVYLMQPLANDHLAGRDSSGNVSFTNVNGAFMMTTPHVVNLERNTGFVTTDPTTLATRAHCYIWSATAVCNAQYGLWHGLGRTASQAISASNPAARYNCYLQHVYGPSGGLPAPWTAYQYRLDTCVFLDPWPVVAQSQARWGLAVDDCHYGYINNCVSFNWFGAGIAFLTGNETANVVQGNFACFVAGMGHRADDPNNVTGYSQTDFLLLAMEGAGIWLRGPLNYLRNNVCCNIYSLAGPFPDGLVMFVGGPGGTFPVPNFQGANTTIAGQYTLKNLNSLPLTQWQNNECYGCMNGMTYWYLAYDNTTDIAYDVGAGTILNQLIWNARGLGIFGYPSNKIVIDGLVFRSDLATVALGQGAVCYTGADYRQRGCIFQNWDIFAAQGIYMPFSAASQGQGGTTFTVQNCNFVVSVGIEVHTPWTSSGGANQPAFQPFTDAIINCTFNLSYWRPTFTSKTCAIWMHYETTGQPNLIVGVTVQVVNYQGVVGQNFHCYYSQQDPSFVMPATQVQSGLVILLGQPASGSQLPDGFITNGALTNGQLVSHGATPLAGSLLPSNATQRPDIIGYVL